MCLRQAGAIADIGFFTVDNLHRILFLPDNTKSRPRDCNGDSSIHTGRSGWWREQLFTGPAVEVSRDERHPLKAQFYEWLNNSDNNGGLTFFYFDYMMQWRRYSRYRLLQAFQGSSRVRGRFQTLL